jgi:transposase
MADTLLQAHRIARAARHEGRDALTEAELTTINRSYTGALARARLDNPATSTSVLAGHARTLAARFDKHQDMVLRKHQDMILRFTTDLAVPLTNNLAEIGVRPVKVQQRSSGGCWRTLQGLAKFAIVQSYLTTTTAACWGIERLDALRRLYTTGPWIPTTLTPETAT